VNSYTVRMPYAGYVAINVEAETAAEAVEQAYANRDDAELQDGEVVRWLQCSAKDAYTQPVIHFIREIVLVSPAPPRAAHEAEGGEGA